MRSPTALQKHRLTQALFNLYPGDFAAGDRGLAACRRGRQELDRLNRAGAHLTPRRPVSNACI